MRGTMPGYFRRYAWAYAELEENVWRSTFTTEREEDFDLYVLLNEELVHFAVSPLVSQPRPECRLRLYAGLLRLNQHLRLVTFAVDDEGDVNLIATLPRHGFVFHHFAAVVDALVAYTELLAHDLARMAREPNFHSPNVPETGA